MITTFQNVHYNFFRLFAGDNLETPITVNTYGGNALSVPVRFGRPKGKDYTEETRETYPQIILQSFAPEKRPGYYLTDQPEYGNLQDTDGDGVSDKIDFLPYPIPFDFRYEVTLCSKDAVTQEAMERWLWTTFIMDNMQNFFKFNINPDETIYTFFGADEICDFVEYRMVKLAEPVRTDGINEVIYQFNLYPFVNLHAPQQVDVLQTLNVSIIQKLP